MSGQGYNFGGERAQERQRRIKRAINDPAYRRRLLGLPPKTASKERT